MPETRIADIMMRVMLFVLLGLLAVVLVGSFWSLQETNERIGSLFRASAARLEDSKTTEEIKVTQTGYLERLKSVTREAMQAHTVAFLFQVFSVALLSAGGYLVLRFKSDVDNSMSNVRRARKQVAYIGDFVGNATVSVALVSQALMAVEMTCFFLRTGETLGYTTQVALARDLLTQLKTKLRDAKQRGRGIDRSQHAILLDQARNLVQSLQRLPHDLAADVADVLDIAQECENLLRSTTFVDRYEKVFAS